MWSQGFTGNGCVVGVIDSGIDSSHSDIKNNVKKRISYVGDENYEDLHFHGTHVAGTIGANGKLKGVAPNATIYDYRVFDGKGFSRPFAIERAIRKAADDGCNIINMSLGGFKEYPELVLYFPVYIYAIL
ncbi:hypothetical protein MHBO_000389 [Bonamia ostreae]